MSERLDRIVAMLNGTTEDVQKAAVDVLVTSVLSPIEGSLPIPRVQFNKTVPPKQWGIEGNVSSGFTVTIHPRDIEEFAGRLGPKHVAKMAHDIIKARRQEEKEEIPLPEAIDTAKVQLGLQLMANASLALLLDSLSGVNQDAVILEILRDASNQAHQRTKQELLDLKRALYFDEFSGG